MRQGFTSTALAALLMASATPVCAQQAESARRFDIPAGPLAGDAIAELESLTIINTFTKALRELAAQSVRRESAADAWLEERRHRLVSPTGDDGGSDKGAP
jgi:hypothetical protein